MLRFERPPDGIVRKGAHDDLQITICNDGVALDPSLLPDTSHVGGEYNAEKSVAVGLRADEAVDCGLAGRAATHTTVWGRPVGDVAEWVSTVWAPKTRARIARIREMADISLNAAVLVAHRVRGPGCLGAHWIAGTPRALLTDVVMGQLEAIDTEWVRLLCHLTGHDWDDLPPDSKTRVHATVYGTGGGCLRHTSLCIDAALTAARGAVSALPHVLAWADDANVDPCEWVRLMIPGDHDARDRKALEAAATVAVEEAGTRRTVRLQEMLTLTRDAISNKVGNDATLEDSRRNLHIAALGVVPEDLPRMATHGIGDRSSLAFALAKVLDLPVWPSITPAGSSKKIPDACACKAPHVAKGSRGRRAADGVTLYMDDAGIHGGVCTVNPPALQRTARHDAFVRFLVRWARACRAEAESHNRAGTFTGASSGLRPADALMYIDRNKPEGTAIDATYVTGGVKAVDDADARKKALYKAGLDARPKLGFLVAGVASNGFVTDDFETMVSLLAPLLANTRQYRANHREDLWCSIGRGLIDILMEQTCMWRDRIHAKSTVGNTGSHPRRSQHRSGRACSLSESVASAHPGSNAPQALAIR
jgi:hypothetical protein